MSEQNFRVEPRTGYGWCVVGSDDDAVYDFSATETEARLRAVQRTVMWADGVDAKLRRRPHQETVNLAVRQALEVGLPGVCAHLVAERLACTVEEVSEVLASLEDRDELAGADECLVCHRPMYCLSPRTDAQ
ncbi:MAG TPA: hypothetical protein VHV82_11540 [Sporichthyaceae bacterium]|jgi:hypothetical protein|nr:hypothetical protein [Sporichthyaceae bacterium]